MRRPRGLYSNTPSVHIEKDRGNEAIILQRRARLKADAQECAGLIDRINSSCGSQRSVSAHTLASSDTLQTASRPTVMQAATCPQETYPLLGNAETGAPDLGQAERTAEAVGSKDADCAGSGLAGRYRKETPGALPLSIRLANYSSSIVLIAVCIVGLFLIFAPSVVLR